MHTDAPPRLRRERQRRLPQPALAEAPPRPDRRWPLRLKRLLAQVAPGEARIPWLVLLLGLVVSGIVAEQQRRFTAMTHLRIERTVLNDVAVAIKGKLIQDVDLINGVAGLFHASQDVSREEFRIYHETLQRDEENLDGIQGIGFSKFLTASQRRELIARVRAEGFPGFGIQPAEAAALGSTILYLEPFNRRNQRAFGFDMYSEATRREAMDRAALQGQPALSGPVRLLQENGSAEQTGVLIYAPVYERGLTLLPRRPADFPGKLRGWAYSPIRVGDLVRAALLSVHNSDLREATVFIQDVAPQQRGVARNRGLRLLFSNQQDLSLAELSHPQTTDITVAGRTWRVGLQLNPPVVPADGLTASFWLILGIGGMASLLASTAARLMVKNHQSTREALAVARQAVEEQALATAVFEGSPLAIVVTDHQGKVVSANQGFARLTGYGGSEILGRSLNLLKSGRHDDAFYAELWRKVREHGFWEGEIWNRRRDGEIRRHALSITAVLNRDLAVSQYIGMLQDVSERHQTQELLRQRSERDPLTGLANRSLLMERTDQALAAVEGSLDRVAILFLDLDGFKAVNDRYGHEVGDRVLQAVARRLQDAVRERDLLCRLGGDEFVVLVPQLSELTDLEALGERLQSAVAMVAAEVSWPIAIGASIGAAWSPDHGVTAGQLLSVADQAMYRIKQSNRVPHQGSGNPRQS